MNPDATPGPQRGGRIPHLWDDIRRAFEEFLALPVAIIAGFLSLAVGMYLADHAGIDWLRGVRAILQDHVFADPQATSDLLGTVASSLIGMTAFSFGLLLLAVQQTAGSMTSHVVDQFLRRRVNQFYFGFFVGLALFSLVILATVDAPYNPILGATVALVLTGVSLCLLLLLLYTTINQIRPVVVIEALHDIILEGRERQIPMIRRTRRESDRPAGARVPLRSTRDGFVVDVDLDLIGKALADPAIGGAIEIELVVSMGSFVAFEDRIAWIHTADREEAAKIGEAVLRSVRLANQRDLLADPAFGIEQILTIAWTSVSTSKSNPAPGLLGIRALRDILARWNREMTDSNSPDGKEPRADRVLPVVYRDDVLEQLMDALETLAVVSTESMQHQNYAEVLRAFAALFERLSPALQERAEDLVLRILSGLGDHVLTADLDRQLTNLVEALRASDRFETASAVHAAQEDLRASIGRLNSRATRVPSV